MAVQRPTVNNRLVSNLGPRRTSTNPPPTTLNDRGGANFFSPEYWDSVWKGSADSWNRAWGGGGSQDVSPVVPKPSRYAWPNATGPNADTTKPWTKEPLPADWWNYQDTASGRQKVGNNPILGGGTDEAPVDDGNGRMTLAEAMAQIAPFMEAMGIKNGGVSFDPMRAQSRSQWSDADARTKAMYDQLQASIGNERGNISAAYDTGIADTNANTAFANKQMQESVQGINNMQTQQAQALGIQEAVANDIAGGNYAAQDAAARAADTAARGQITANQMASGKAGGLAGISNLVGAAGLQGAMDRSSRLNELNRLLAQYDVQEQEANAASQSNYASSAMKYVMDLMGLDRKDYEQDSTDEWHAQQELNRWDIANLPGSSQTGKPAPLDSASAREIVTGLYGENAFKDVNTQKLAKELYLKLQGY